MTNFSDIRERLESNLEKFEGICEKLNRSQRFYVVGLVFGMLSAFWYITPFQGLFRTTFWISGVFFTCALISDLLAIYQKVWGAVIGKGFLLLVYAASTNLAYAAAARIINELVKFDTSTLTYTVNFVAVLLAPLLIFFGTCAALVVVLVLGQFYLMITLYSKELRQSKCISRVFPQSFEEYPGRTFIVRLLVFPALLGMLWGLSSRIEPNYERFIEKTASSFIFNFEALRFSRCEVDPASRVIRVTDKEIIVATHIDGNYRFEPKKCIPLIKP